MVSTSKVIEKALLDKAKKALEKIVGERYSDDLESPYWSAVGDGIDVKVCVSEDGDFWLEFEHKAEGEKRRRKKSKKKNAKKVPWLRFDAFIANPEDLVHYLLDRMIEAEKHKVA